MPHFAGTLTCVQLIRQALSTLSLSPWAVQERDQLLAQSEEATRARLKQQEVKQKEAQVRALLQQCGPRLQTLLGVPSTGAGSRHWGSLDSLTCVCVSMNSVVQGQLLLVVSILIVSVELWSCASPGWLL